jgi:hypothetical protein
MVHPHENGNLEIDIIIDADFLLPFVAPVEAARRLANFLKEMGAGGWCLGDISTPIFGRGGAIYRYGVSRNQCPSYRTRIFFSVATTNLPFSFPWNLKIVFLTMEIRAIGLSSSSLSRITPAWSKPCL